MKKDQGWFPKRLLVRDFYGKNTLKRALICFCLSSLLLTLSVYFPLILKFPVYIDEILYKMSVYHFVVNGFSNNLMPQCGAQWLHEAPLLTRPVMWFSYFFGGSLSTLWLMRFFGMVFWTVSLGFLSLALAIFYNQSKLEVGLILYSVSFLGALPFAGSLSRPENIFLFFVSFWFFVWVLIVPHQSVIHHRSNALVSRSARFQAVLRILLTILGFFVITSMHRAILFSPLIVVLTLTAVSRKWFTRFLVGIFYGVATYQEFLLARLYINCPASPNTRAYTMLGTVDPNLIFAAPNEFLSESLFTLSRIGEYWKETLFSGRYSLFWLPLGFAEDAHFNRVGVYFFGAIGLASIALFFFIIVKKRSKEVWFGFMLMLCLAALVILDRRIAWYRAPIVTVLLTGIFLNLLLSSNLKVIRYVSLFLCGSISLWSSSILIRSLRQVEPIWSVSSPLLQGTRTSFNQWNYDIFRKKHQSQAEKCLQMHHNPDTFLVDGITYPLLSRQKFNPVLLWNVIFPSQGSYSEIKAILERNSVRGGYVQCDSSTDLYFEPIFRLEGFCCYVQTRDS